jgi:hypothetical protein
MLPLDELDDKARAERTNAFQEHLDAIYLADEARKRARALKDAVAAA